MLKGINMRNCPKCESEMRIVEVSVAGAKRRVISLQCVKCDYYEFEKKVF